MREESTTTQRREGDSSASPKEEGKEGRRQNRTHTERRDKTTTPKMQGRKAAPPLRKNKWAAPLPTAPQHQIINIYLNVLLKKERTRKTVDEKFMQKHFKNIIIFCPARRHPTSRPNATWGVRDIGRESPCQDCLSRGDCVQSKLASGFVERCRCTMVVVVREALSVSAGGAWVLSGRSLHNAVWLVRSEHKVKRCCGGLFDTSWCVEHYWKNKEITKIMKVIII